MISEWPRCCGSARLRQTSVVCTSREGHRADEELARRLTQLDTEQQQLRRGMPEGRGPGGSTSIGWSRPIAILRVARSRGVNCGVNGESLTVEIDRRRESLVKADQDVRILEKLRERRLRTPAIGRRTPRSQAARRGRDSGRAAVMVNQASALLAER